MKSTKGNQQNHNQEDATNFSSSPTNDNCTKDAKNSDKASAIRSKHSVTEQKRRSKINERFQILRDLIPNSDQKRDTASFLSEVIQYVQFLQEKVQKYEGSGQAWSSEPSKLTPWRNSHWRVPNFGSPPPMKNTCSGVPSFLGRFDESNAVIPSTMQSSQQNAIDSDTSIVLLGKSNNLQTELPNQGLSMHIPMQTCVPDPVRNDGAFPVILPRPSSDAQLAECPINGDPLNPQELTVEGGTISISSAYSEELLSSLTHALQTTGVDLSQASISVQIDLGKRANREGTPGISALKDTEYPMPSGNQVIGHFHDPSNRDDMDQSHKRLKV
ncbi:basic helix-loop-helix transcription factor [Lithospermum erythrorhizon]|uniref:Basic helix-loop-helix transcription factor n=1 Tax=Lithospermum erythrorhizon TaxID=34254 RepID=A0AAV3RQM9_LITER